MPTDATPPSDSGSPSLLARLLIDDGAVEWSALSEALVSGQLRIPDPSEVILNPPAPPRGLLRQLLDSHSRAEEIGQSPDQADAFDPGLEALALTLLDLGVGPLSPDDAIDLAETCCSIGLSRVLERLLPQLPPRAMVRWLVAEYDPKHDAPTARGVHLLAWCGYTSVLKVLFDHGLADVNQLSPDRLTPLAFARHPATVAMLAASGADATLRDRRGLTAMQAWSANGINVSIQQGLRAAWNKSFPLDRSDPKAMEQAAQDLVTGISEKPGTILQKDMRRTGIEPGQLVMGKSLPEWLALDLLSRLNAPSKASSSKSESRASPTVVWAGNDPTRLSTEGISDGFLYGLLASPKLISYRHWSDRSSAALEASPEHRYSLEHQFRTVHRIARLVPFTGKTAPTKSPAFPSLARAWLAMVLESKTPFSAPSSTDLACFLDAPDPDHPQRLSPLRQGLLSDSNLFNTAVRRVLADGRDGMSSPDLSAWFEGLLIHLSDNSFAMDPDPTRHGLPLIPAERFSANRDIPVGTLWMSRMLDAGNVLSPTTKSPQLKKALETIRQKYPQLSAELEAMDLEVTTTAHAPSSTSRSTFRL